MNHRSLRLAGLTGLLFASCAVAIVAAGCENEAVELGAKPAAEEPVSKAKSPKAKKKKKAKGWDGLVIGKSKRADAVRIYGKPASDGKAPKDLGRLGRPDGFRWLTWNRPKGPITGADRLVVWFPKKTKRLGGAALLFEGRGFDGKLSTAAIKAFGSPSTAGFLEFSDRDSLLLMTWKTAGSTVLGIEEEKAGDSVFGFRNGGVGFLLGDMAAGIGDVFGRMAVPMLQKYRIGKAFRLGDFEYVVHSVKPAAAVGRSRRPKKAGPGATWLVVRYSIENVGNQTATKLAGDLKIYDASGRTFLPSNEGTRAVAYVDDIDTMLSQLQPGIRREQIAVFELPRNVLTNVGGFRLEVPEKGFARSGKAMIKIKFVDYITAASK